MEVNIPSISKQILTRIAIWFFRAIRAFKRGVQAVFGRLARALAPLGRVLVRFFILPIYRTVVTMRLRLQRLALPARGFFLFFLTNRYVLHGTVFALIVVALASNLSGRAAQAQDVGQKSILFALATQNQSQLTQEDVQPSQGAKDTHYLANAALIPIPHVDFDYDGNAAPDAVTPSALDGGTVTAAPYDVADTQSSSAPRTSVQSYTVQSGDTIGTIAERFGINVGSILWNNNLNNQQFIRVGQTLTIPPTSGILVTVAKGDTLTKLADRYNADADQITSFNNLDGSLPVGKQIMIPGGTPPSIIPSQTLLAANTPAPRQTPAPAAPSFEPPPSSVPGEEISEDTPSDDSVVPSDNEDALDGSIPIPKPPDADASQSPAGHLFWPTVEHSITQYYSWQHTGIDIDGDYTTPIYAADNGTVEQAGWNAGGYGLMILIDHPDGYKTRYGHASKLFVKAGDVVKKGQVIGMVGTTGRSTGTHLHFEVYVHDVRVNPLGYIHP